MTASGGAIGTHLEGCASQQQDCKSCSNYNSHGWPGLVGSRLRQLLGQAVPAGSKGGASGRPRAAPIDGAASLLFQVDIFLAIPIFLLLFIRPRFLCPLQLTARFDDSDSALPAHALGRVPAIDPCVPILCCRASRHLEIRPRDTLGTLCHCFRCVAAAVRNLSVLSYGRSPVVWWVGEGPCGCRGLAHLPQGVLI